MPKTVKLRSLRTGLPMTSYQSTDYTIDPETGTIAFVTSEEKCAQDLEFNFVLSRNPNSVLLGNAGSILPLLVGLPLDSFETIAVIEIGVKNAIEDLHFLQKGAGFPPNETVSIESKTLKTRVAYWDNAPTKFVVEVHAQSEANEELPVYPNFEL
jgi:hypothetical protein